VVNSSQGGGSKDTWVQADARTVESEAAPVPPDVKQTSTQIQK